jgi:hypothetical protein
VFVSAQGACGGMLFVCLCPLHEFRGLKSVPNESEKGSAVELGTYLHWSMFATGDHAISRTLDTPRFIFRGSSSWVLQTLPLPSVNVS